MYYSLLVYHPLRLQSTRGKDVECGQFILQFRMLLWTCQHSITFPSYPYVESKSSQQEQ